MRRSRKSHVVTTDCQEAKGQRHPSEHSISALELLEGKSPIIFYTHSSAPLTGQKSAAMEKKQVDGH